MGKLVLEYWSKHRTRHHSAMEDVRQQLPALHSIPVGGGGNDRRQECKHAMWCYLEIFPQIKPPFFTLTAAYSWLFRAEVTITCKWFNSKLNASEYILPSSSSQFMPYFLSLLLHGCGLFMGNGRDPMAGHILRSWRGSSLENIYMIGPNIKLTIKLCIWYSNSNSIIPTHM